MAATGLAGIRPVFAQTPPAELPPQPGDFLVATTGATALAPDDIKVGSAPFGAFAMAPDGLVRGEDYLNSIYLLRFNPADLPEETKAKAAEGVVAYTIICTHAGCPVSDQLEEGLIVCHCHGSQFDPVENGDVVTGPAIRKLPQLTLEVQEGKLLVAEGFDGRIGGDMIGEDDR